MSDQFEQLLRETLETVTVRPPAGTWGRIDARLLALQRRRRQKQLYLYGSTAAAVLILLISLIFNYYVPANYRPEAVTLVSMIQQEAPEIASLPGFPSSPVNIPHPSRAGKSPDARNKLTEIHTEHLTATVAGQDPEMPEIGDVAMPEDFIPLTSKAAYDNLIAYNRLLGKDNYPEAPKREKKTAVEKRTSDSKPNISYTVGGYIAPAYSSGDYGAGSQEYARANYDQGQMSGVFNLNGGLTLAINTGKRLSIETGIGFSRFGQKTSDANVYIPSQFTSPDFAAQTEVLTPLGNVKSVSNAIVTITEKDSETLNAIRNTQSGTIEQQFGAIEVPFQLRYYINDSRIKFSVSGGLGAIFFVENDSYLSYSGNKERMGKTEDIRSFNLSTHVGIGIEYPITKAIHFRFEPGFKYYLQSISRNEAVEFKPYSFNISTGIGIRF